MNAEGLVAEFIAAIERGDIDGALSYLAPTCEYDNVPISKAIGHEEIKASPRRCSSAPTARPSSGSLRQAASGNLVMNERVDRLAIGGKTVELARRRGVGGRGRQDRPVARLLRRRADEQPARLTAARSSRPTTGDREPRGPVIGLS